jgi:two-component sensor histidine kinase
MEKDLTDANLEKEILLKEIHHRVKNNMQVISSLLSMQSRSIQEPSIQTIFRETQTRVRSLSLVHELLYKSDSLKNIDYRKYLSELSKYIFNSHNPTNRDINCIISENDVQISIEKAIPCSLVITELLTNSLKYAFIDGQKGEIKIDFRYESQSDEFILLYQDNGVGFLPGTDPRTPAGFGSTLINGLTRQLSGTITIKDGNPGVRYTLKFPKDK